MINDLNQEDNTHEIIRPGFGWIPSVRDIRDFTTETPEIKKALGKSKIYGAAPLALPSAVDLRRFCSPVENQGSTNSCTANAGVGALEYIQIRSGKKVVDGSRLFLYKVTRNLMGGQWPYIDGGAYINTTLKAMLQMGVCPERYWPFFPAQVNAEPTAFCYQMAKQFQVLRYYRHDVPGFYGEAVLENIKRSLANQIPTFFGFTVYSSMPWGVGKGLIPYPTQNDRVTGGHAVLAVGYDNSYKTNYGKGALLIRNSWGSGWGDKGYGWLPYSYVLNSIASEFFSLINVEYNNVPIGG